MTQQKTNLKKSIIERKAYFKILFAITGCSLTAVLLLFSIMYTSVRKMMTQQSIELTMQSFSQLQSIVENMSATANTVATQVLLDDACGQVLLAVGEDDLDVLSTYKAVRQLSIYKNVNKSIDSIYLYNADIDTLVTSEVKSVYDSAKAFYDSELIDYLQNYADVEHPVLFKRRVQKNYENGYVQDKDVYTYIVPNMYTGGQLKSAVIINVSSDWLVSRLVETQHLEDSLMLVFDALYAGEATMPLIELNGLSDVPSSSFNQSFMEMLSKNETFTTCTYNGEQFFMSYVKADKLNWHFVKVSKWDTIFGVLQELKSGAIFLVFSIAAICILLSLVGAGLIYKLYDAIEGKYNKLVHSKRAHAERLRENFLHDFLISGSQLQGEQLQNKLNELEIEFVPNRKHTIVLLSIIHYEEMKQHYGTGAIYQIKYGLCNIFAELCSATISTVSVIGKDNYITLLLTPKNEEALNEQQVQQVFEQFCKQVKVFVSRDFYLVGTSNPVTVEELPACYNMLCGALSETFFYSPNTYLNCETMLREHSQPLENADFNHKILPTLLRGNIDEARKQYDAFVLTLVGCCRDDCLNALIWLGFSVARTLKEINVTSEKDDRNYFGDFLMKIMSCEQQDEVDILFIAMFEEALAMIQQANNKTCALGKVDDIQSYIQSTYTDANLSLEGVADKFGISPSYLGKIFRKATGNSLAEYINEVRLEHVVEQMARSNKPIKDIAAACGFSGTNYFYTYFKKKYGITPQAYRTRFLQP